MITTLSLDGSWTLFCCSNSKEFTASVPGCVHTDLLANGAIPDPFHGTNELDLQWIEAEDWEYRREFEIPANLLEHQCIELVCTALDTVATVWINDSKAGNAANMFHSHRFDVKRFLRTGTNSIRVHFASPLNAIRALHDGPLIPMSNDRVGGRTLLRKEQCSFGWDWGARFATSGICESIFLEASSHARLESVQVSQEHLHGQVRVLLQCDIVSPVSDIGSTLSTRAALTLDGNPVASSTSDGTSLTLTVPDPQLWWPTGLGGQPLHSLRVELLDADGRILDTWQRRIGLRDLKLEQKPDAWGLSFQFVVNGVPVFAKGANWIPCHAFMPERTETIYRDLLTSARDAHMNMIRAWGGGSYEREIFFDLCDELGLLVWQDFMFACSLYPGTPEFTASVKDEAEYQIRRLRHHACMALWCGNNEAEHMDPEATSKGNAAEDYRRMFYELLPSLVAANHPGISYIPSSPFNPAGLVQNPNNDDSGDTHFWGVWHAREPVELYEKQNHRFFSEFGMQAFPHPETVATFTQDTNLFGPDMDCHQKNGGGNAIIFDYIARLYRFPKDYRGAAMLSQLNQAFCMKTGIEHMRRNMPRTMGALFWQLNDNWPVASWSAIDFGGRWKALQYAARRFFAPLLVSVKRIGEEVMHVSSNTLFSTINGAEVHVTCDGLQPVEACLTWNLHHIPTGEILRTGSWNLRLEPNSSILAGTLDFSPEIALHGRATLVLQTRLVTEAVTVSSNTTFFTPPKRIEFSRHKPAVNLAETSPGNFQAVFQTTHVLPAVMFYLADGTDVRASDNFFDLYPGEPTTVVIRPLRAMCLEEFERQLRVESLTDWYA